MCVRKWRCAGCGDALLCTCRYQFVAVCPVAARATTTQSITQSSITILHSRRLPQMLLLHDDIVAGRKEEQLPPQSLACSYCAFLHPSTPAPTLPPPMPLTTTHQLSSSRLTSRLCKTLPCRAHSCYGRQIKMHTPNGATTRKGPGASRPCPPAQY